MSLLESATRYVREFVSPCQSSRYPDPDSIGLQPRTSSIRRRYSVTICRGAFSMYSLARLRLHPVSAPRYVATSSSVGILPFVPQNFGGSAVQTTPSSSSPQPIPQARVSGRGTVAPFSTCLCTVLPFSRVSEGLLPQLPLTRHPLAPRGTGPLLHCQQGPVSFVRPRTSERIRPVCWARLGTSNLELEGCLCPKSETPSRDTRISSPCTSKYGRGWTVRGATFGTWIHPGRTTGAC